MLLTSLVIAIFVACVACFFNQGLWSAAVALVNVTLSALIAMNFFEPVANLLGKSNYADLVAVWGVFCISAGGLRFLADWLSPECVKFDRWLDIPGAIALSLGIGWVLTCLAVTSLHVAPLSRTAFNEEFMSQPEAIHANFGPDRLWLSFVQTQSRGALARGDEYVFDPQAEFIFRYADRRARPPK